MSKEAIMHMPLSSYAWARDEHCIALRLRVAKGDEITCICHYGDRVDPKKEMTCYPIPMTRGLEDDLYAFYECTIACELTRICYYFEIDCNGEKWFYTERGLTEEKLQNRTEYFQYPYIRREDIIQVPNWAKDAVMYQIFPASFGAKGNVFNTIADKASYLADMGINCIYLNPVFKADSYHKYDTIDYIKVDEDFGTLDEFKSMVKRLHEKGIRVLLDGVFNHCGSGFFAFQDVLSKGSSSEYYDWFYHMPLPIVYDTPPSYEAFAYVKEMPKLNNSNPLLMEYLIRVGCYWIEDADIDGWRLDVANEVNHDFWRSFRKVVRSVKEDAFLIGEIWEDSQVWLMGDQFDSTMNYRFSNLCEDFFARGNLTVTQFDHQIQRMLVRYPDVVAQVQMNFLDTHDIPRFLSHCAGERRKLELAFFYLIMSCGIPSILYGDEQYIEGVEERDYRKDMDFACTCDFTDKLGAWIAFRKEHSALRNGNYRSILCDDKTGLYVFAREDEKEKVIIAINNSENPVDLGEYGYKGCILNAWEGIWIL